MYAMSKKLYLSDLDGTLLGPDARLSDFTIETLNALGRRGLHFTVATARTAATVLKILEPLELSIPLVLMNGAQIYDRATGRYLHVEYIHPSAVAAVTGILDRHGVTGFMYGLQEHKLSTYYERLETEPLRKFVLQRETLYNKVFTPVNSFAESVDRGILYFVLLDQYDRLAPIRDAMESVPGLATAFYSDIYSDSCWYLEVFNDRVSKGNAAMRLREMLGYHRMVGFGDHLNDLPLFEVCDEAYAVGNAHRDLAAQATASIGPNTEDGVAHWLAKNF